MYNNNSLFQCGTKQPFKQNILQTDYRRNSYNKADIYISIPDTVHMVVLDNKLRSRTTITNKY